MATKRSWDKHLTRLRDLMKNATNLAEPVNYFFDHLARDRAFLKRSTWEDAGLDMHLRPTAERLVGPGTLVKLPMFKRYGELRHGTCLFGVLPTTVLYHSGINVGIVAVPMGGTTELMRISLVANQPRGKDTP